MAMVLFAGVPLAIALAAAASKSSHLVRGLLVAEALALVLITSCLLRMQGAI
jgi:hypothetical protein